MRFALLMYADPAHTLAMTDEQLAEVRRKHEAIGEELGPRLVGGAGLALPQDTMVVRETGAASGPLFDTAEHLTAYYEVETTQEHAQEIAARILDHHVTSVEVRFIHDHV
jgi:hypothetical protein